MKCLDRCLPSLARVRIFVGGLAAIMFLSAAAIAEESPARKKKILIAATSTGYETAVLAHAVAGATETQTATFNDCRVSGTGLRLTVIPSGAVAFRNVSAGFCFNNGPFALFDAPDNVDVKVRVRYQNGANFTIPPFGSVAWNAPAVVNDTLVSDETEGIFITVFPTVDSPMTVRLYKGDDPTQWVDEEFNVRAPVSQHEVQAKGVFSKAEVKIGWSFFGCFPAPNCSSVPEVFGFVSNGARDGGTFEFYPFGQDD